MAEKTSEIMNHIEDERRRLGYNIEEIEDRIKGATDLKGYFDRNTALFLGSAVAAGLIASLVIRKRRQSAGYNKLSSSMGVVDMETPSRSEPTITRRFADKHMDRISDTFDHIVDGLIGVACGKIVSLIADAVPAFQSEYDARHRDRNWSSLRTANFPPDATPSGR